MKQRVLFSHSYFLRFDPKQWATGQPYAPLGTLYAAATLRENGCEVALFDTMFARSPEEVMPSIREFHPDIFVICDDGFNYLTKMCLTNMREAAFTMIRLAKQVGCTVIVSSSDSTDHFENYLQQGADFIIIGEVEQTLTELVSGLKNESTDLTRIQGLAYQQASVVMKTLKREVTKELDSIPTPAWDLIDIAPYREMWMQSRGYFSMNVVTTRGCPFKCNWCAKPIYGNRYNSRAAALVVKEIKMLKETFGIGHVWFCDDIFGLKPGWVKEFAEAVKKEELQFRFKIQSRADLLVQEDYISNMALAGCENVWMGAESGSQKILDAMDKGITIGQIETATKLLKQYRILPSFFLQFGYLGETRADIQSTIRMVNRLLPHSIGISVSYPLPGTVFYEKVKAQLTEKANWTDSNELELMFRNTYRPDFYRQLHRYVHRSHRLHLSLFNLKSMIRHPLAGGMNVCRKAISMIYYFPAMLMSKQKLNKLARA